MRRVLVVAVCLLLFLPSCSADKSEEDTSFSYRTEEYESGPYSLMLSFPDEALEYGDTIKLELKVKCPEGESWEFLPVLPEEGAKTSSFIVRNISRGADVISADGLVVTSIAIEIEAYLPGEIIFPPLRVRFRQVMMTDEVSLNVESAFDADSAQHELSPLYVPETEERPKAIVILIPAAAVIAAVIIFIILRRRRLKAPGLQPEPGKTYDELILDFKRDFIEADDISEQREAFRRLMEIIISSPILAGEVEKLEQYRTLCEEARFSKDGLSSADGNRLLRKIFEDVEKEGLL